MQATQLTKSNLSSLSAPQKSTWLKVCELDDLVINSGICALIPSQQGNQQQIAIFTLQTAPSDLAGTTPAALQIHALSNWDPIGKANVMSRGIIGSIKHEAVVNSPMYKQHFSLTSGLCIEDPTIALTVYDCQIIDANVCIKLSSD